jgi:hypothetical protein
MQQGCPQPHEEVPSALETLLLESASYLKKSSFWLKENKLRFRYQNQPGNAVSSEIHSEPINTHWGQNAVFLIQMAHIVYVQ